jgi:hypothetical protein
MFHLVMTTAALPARTSDFDGAANDLRSAHLLLLANHGELANLTAGQLRDALQLDLGTGDGYLTTTAERGRTQACNARFLEAQALLQTALRKIGVRDASELRSLALPSSLCDALGGLFDMIVLAQDTANVEANRKLAAQIERTYEGLRAATPRLRDLPRLPAITAAPEATTQGETIANAVGLAFGQHPRFWPTSRWVMLVGAVLAAVLFLVYVADVAK